MFCRGCIIIKVTAEGDPLGVETIARSRIRSLSLLLWERLKQTSASCPTLNGNRQATKTFTTRCDSVSQPLLESIKGN